MNRFQDWHNTNIEMMSRSFSRVLKKKKKKMKIAKMNFEIHASLCRILGNASLPEFKSLFGKQETGQKDYTQFGQNI
jgi:hypothetical protein